MIAVVIIALLGIQASHAEPTPSAKSAKQWKDIASSIATAVNEPSLDPTVLKVTVYPSPNEGLKMWRIANFFSPEECDYIMNVTLPHLESCSGERNCTEFMGGVHFANNPVFAELEERMRSLLPAAATTHDTDVIHVVRYGTGGRFNEHYDVPHITTSMMVYLTDVEKENGGATEFVSAKVSVQPRRGELVVWHNCVPNGGAVDPLAYHRGSPVLTDTSVKWIVNFFVTSYQLPVFIDRCKNHQKLRLPANNTAPFHYVSPKKMAQHPTIDLRLPAVVLTEDKWDTLVNTKLRSIFVVFHTPWSEQCKSLLPAIEKVASYFHDRAEKDKVVVGKLDATQHERISDRFKVGAFPTMLLFVMGSTDPIAYGGDRSEKSVIAFINDKLGLHQESTSKKKSTKKFDVAVLPDGTTLLSEESYRNFLAKGDKDGLILSMGDGPTPQYLLDIAKVFPQTGTFLVARADDESNSGTLTLSKKNIKVLYDVAGPERTTAGVLQFLSDNGITASVEVSSRAVELTDANFEAKVLKSEESVFVVFCTSWKLHCKNMSPIMIDVSRRFKSQGVVVAHVDSSSNKKLSDSFKHENLLMMLFVKGTKEQPLTYKGSRDANAIHSYITRWTTTKDSKTKAPKGTSKGSSVQQDPLEVVTWTAANMEYELVRTFKNKGQTGTVFGVTVDDTMNDKFVMDILHHVRTIAKGYSLPVTFVVIPKDNNEMFVKHRHIEVHPTLIAFKTREESEAVVMTGPITANVVLPFMQGLSEAPPTDVTTEEDFDKTIRTTQRVLVVFHLAWSGHSERIRGHIPRISKNADIKTLAVNMGADDMRRLADRYGLKKAPAVVLFTDNVPATYQGYRGVQHILKWIKSEKPTVDDIIPVTTVAELSEIVKNRDTVVMFVKASCSLCHILYHEVATAASMFTVAVSFVIFDTINLSEEAAYEIAMDQYLPTFVVYNAGATKGATRLTDNPSIASLVRWLGKLYPEVRVQPSKAPPSLFPGKAVVLTEDNFDEIVLNSEYDVFVDMYAPWCAHCKTLLPMWDELAMSLESQKIVVAKLDLTEAKLLGSKYQVGGIPHLMWFPKKSKDGFPYEGDKTYTSLLEFAVKQSGI